MIKPVRKLMEAAGQDFPNEQTAELYRRLMAEETLEFIDAETEVEEFDACLDTIWVIIGFMLAKGWLIRSGWEEVVRSNLSKIPADGVMLKREDGKLLKGPDYSPPNLGQFLK